jgi:hypothetical protein
MDQGIGVFPGSTMSAHCRQQQQQHGAGPALQQAKQKRGGGDPALDSQPIGGPELQEHPGGDNTQADSEEMQHVLGSTSTAQAVGEGARQRQ